MIDLWAVVCDVVLEGEMYQLSHLLTDQKTVMTSMMELSLTGNKGLQTDILTCADTRYINVYSH